ncbi:MAG TPA: PilZ domain-containing protein [Vicinamibacterales bacterium]|jgi:hypothetical protein|nr:PilZ domain-containing protein [Vicinamibacterales bacterium]
MPSSVVIIGASDMLDALRARAGVSDADVFPDTQPLQALQAITEFRPSLVVLERLFAATSRGAALINRIKSDPGLEGTEIRVLSHTGDYTRVIARPAPPQSTPAPPRVEVTESSSAAAVDIATPAPPAQPLDWRGTRRAPRYRAQTGVEVHVDGTPAELIDVSVLGAQVLSTNSLRPNQRVRLSLMQEQGPIRVAAAVAWAKFELPRVGGAPQYRAGLEFADADEGALNGYCDRVKK